MSDFERVYTVTDYHDGPREGIASVNGKPHAYASVFDSAEDEYSDVFELRPLDEETLQLALEDWEIWLRWRRAYDAGATALETHPALDADRARHDELSSILTARLAAVPGPPVRARAEFRPTPGRQGSFDARWTIAAP